MLKKNRHLLSLLIFSSPMALAGHINSPAGPNDLASAMYNLQDICNRLETGATGSKQIFTEPTSGPADSPSCTLNDIMEKTPEVDDTNGATPAEVLNGKTFWGLNSGNWGTKTGTLATQTPSDTTVDQSAGHYNAFDLSKVDTDLTASNIKSGVTLFGIEGTHAGGGSATVAKTGQSQCYDQATNNAETCVENEHKGQDGFHKKGASETTRFTDNSNGTITDKLTGLIWLKNANCNNETMNWWDALDFAYTLFDGSTNHNGGDCDLSDSSNAGDWRLPNVKELHSLIDFSQGNPALPTGDPFSGVQTGFYWSSTTNADDASYAWYVVFFDGNVNSNDKTIKFYVWPLRGGR